MSSEINDLENTLISMTQEEIKSDDGILTRKTQKKGSLNIFNGKKHFPNKMHLKLHRGTMFYLPKRETI